ncbi:hypothetical protein IAD21_04629 [Abditibacteriota bacterium]|nr:hypothetical protein IAD21_04629 [Abditibacteriota bacterium]
MAMLMVFVFHTWEFSNKPHFAIQFGSLSFETIGNSTFGAHGVPVFMVLSGFCLFFPLCVERRRMRDFNWRSYAARRVRRMVPPYYAAIAYTLAPAVLVAIVRYAKGREHAASALPSAFDLLVHLTFTHTLFESTFFNIAGAFWSLGLEVQFYLTFPLIVWAFSRFGVRALCAVAVVSFCYQAVTHSLGVGEARVEANFFMARWTEFAAGMGTALLVSKRLEQGVKTPTWQGVALVLLGFSAFRLHMPDFGPLLSKAALFELHRSATIGGLLYAVCTSTRPVTFLWSNRVSAGLGFMSYSFYLIHQPTMWYLSHFLTRFGPRMSDVSHFVILMTVGFGICLGIAYGFFLLFEKPFLKSWPLVWTGKKGLAPSE